MSRFLPARTNAEEKYVSVVSDLDALLSEGVAFKLNGTIHHIRPLTTGEFLEVYEAFAQCDQLAKRKDINAEEIIETYARLFSSVCETIGKKEVENMTQAQCGALFVLIMDSITGKAQAPGLAEKKNLLRIPTSSLTGPSLSARFAGFIRGALRTCGKCLRGVSSLCRWPQRKSIAGR